MAHDGGLLNETLVDYAETAVAIMLSLNGTDIDREMNASSTGTSPNHQKPIVLATPCSVIVFLSYIFGCVGNLVALIHLWRNVRNTKHALMLKCLLTNDLIGLSGMFVQMCLHLYLPKELVAANMRHFCILRVIWRVFGISSGCVAFIMALERYIALAKPFFYHKYVTDNLIRKSIFILWTIGAFITFLPLFGFGIYFDEKKQTCVRYKSATEPMDIAYAYLFFSVGIVLCVGIVICNLSVRKVLYQSHRKMCRQFGSIKPTPMMSRSTRQTQKSASFTDSSIMRMFNEPTTEEIRFAKLMTVLSVFFLICWLPQMITIILLQKLSTAMKLKLAWLFRLSDILILVHFMLDPYIYVLLKQSRRSDLRTMIRYVFSRNQFKIVETAISPLQKSTNSSPLP
ncbi:prostaglandin E2 receptor EP4 subtype-like [Anopheles albimanus]|uniref:G-protein coupled receptors family 1 profile domain-containing protein n=1 Tax=Anopheles albimanus TaxID=7167 RepID=A0A8W7JJ25_ANOAL|nr:prostaglandin E2 receptor EP4 subtype-like [Anopheles albimanus]